MVYLIDLTREKCYCYRIWPKNRKKKHRMWNVISFFNSFISLVFWLSCWDYYANNLDTHTDTDTHARAPAHTHTYTCIKLLKSKRQLHSPEHGMLEGDETTTDIQNELHSRSQYIYQLIYWERYILHSSFNIM